MARSRARTAATLLGIVTAATAGALAVKEARRRTTTRLYPGAAPVSMTSRNARSAAMAGVGAKAGGAYAVHRAKRAFASAERQVELDTGSS